MVSVYLEGSASVTIDELVKGAAGAYGAIFLLLLGVIGFLTERVVPGKRLERSEKRCDRYEEMLLESLQTGNRATRVAETVVQKQVTP